MDKIKQKEFLEREILSVMINSQGDIPLISQSLKPGDFSKKHNRLFEEVLNFGNDQVLDINTILIELSKKNIEGWGINELMTLQLQGSGDSLEILKRKKRINDLKDLNFSLEAEKYLKDTLIKIKDDFDGLYSLTELQTNIESKLSTVENFKEEKSFSDKLPEILAKIEDEISSQKSHSINTSNFPSLNNSTSGLQPGNLIAITGSYKSGKTTLALNLTLDFVMQGLPTGFISLELSEAEIHLKFLSMLTDVPYENLREPKKLSSEHKHKLAKSYKSEKDLPLFISDKPLTEIELRNKIKYWRDRFGVKILILDYIGYLRSSKRFDTREREMSYYSNFLKMIAKELGIVLIVLAQLNRIGKINPGTENLAESISLARDSDFLFVIYRPLDAGLQSEGGITYTEDDFLCKLDTSRHTKGKKQFLLKLNDSGRFKEMLSEYDNSAYYHTN